MGHSRLGRVQPSYKCAVSSIASAGAPLTIPMARRIDCHDAVTRWLDRDAASTAAMKTARRSLAGSSASSRTSRSCGSGALEGEPMHEA
jgi:hypothetical protein